MFKNLSQKLKTILLYVTLGLVIVAVCVASALYAIHLQNRAPADDGLLKQTLSAHDYTATIFTPFEMQEDLAFNVEPEILYYVKTSRAFYGYDEDLSLHIYSVTYKTELFDDSWGPNIENMADVSIKTLKKNKLFRNLESEKKYIKIGNAEAIEVVSVYRKGADNMVQRVLHVPMRTCTWSFKATFKDNSKNSRAVTKIFDSIVINSN